MSNDKEFKRRQFIVKYPLAGDYWHEFCSPVLVVLSVNYYRREVTICKTKIYSNCRYYWNLDAWEVWTFEEFENYLKYATQEGYWARPIVLGMVKVVDHFNAWCWGLI